MSRERIRLGQFMSRRLADPDDPGDLLAPGGQLDPDKSFLEINLPSEQVVPSIPAVIPPMPTPALGEPGDLPPQPPPQLTLTSPADRQPSLPTTLSRPPADPIVVPEPPRTVPAAEQPHPDFVPTVPAAEQPHPDFTPTVPAAEQPHPDFTPTQPSAEQPHPDFTPTVPASPQPSLGIGAGPAPLPPPPEVANEPTVPASLQRVDLEIPEPHARYTGIPVNTQGDLALDPDLYLKQVDVLANNLPGVAVHSAIQVGMFLQNNRGRIWNPALIAAPPIAQNFLLPALDLPLLGEPPQDIHLEMARGEYSIDRITAAPPFYEKQGGIGGGTGGAAGGIAAAIGSFFGTVRLVGAPSQDSSIVDDPTRVPSGEPIVQAGLKERNKYTPEVQYSENIFPRMEDLVDAALGIGGSPVLVDGDEGLQVHVGTTRSPEKLSKIFQNTRQKITSPHGWRAKEDIASSEGLPATSPLSVAAFPRGIIPAKIKGENEFGFAAHEPGDALPVNDDDAYLPLSFTDLRPVGNKFRTVYFRPFITNLSEEFSPQWNKANYYGRADAVATYMSTARTLNIGFSLHAFGPEDVRTIYQKLNWLSSMVYPEYDKDLTYRSGPVCRMRVGNVIDSIGSDGSRGLPGVIDSLSYDYSDSLWELKKDLKVPVNIKVTLTFTVLHDRPIGRGADGKFGGIGSIRDGIYIPPNLKESGPHSESREKYPDVEEGTDSFRSVGDMNGYTLDKI